MTGRNGAPVETVLRQLLGAGLATSAAALAIGIVMSLVGYSSMAAELLSAGVVLLVLLPVVSVVVVLADQLRRGDWRFAAASAAVLGILIYGFVRAIS